MQSNNSNKNDNNYKAQCESFIKEWLGKNTFHKCETIALENYEERNVEFKAKVCNVFKIEIIKKKNVAQINAFTNNLKHNKPQFKDETFYTRQDYEFALKKNLAIANEVGFQKLFNRIKDGDFGIFKKECYFYIDEARITYQYKCHKCNGLGHLRCECKNGKVKCGSYGCKNGRIRRTQSKSGSPLFFVNTRVSSNFNVALPLLHNKKEQVYYDDCDNCQGTGLQTCSKCNGSAILKCGACGGSGLQYEVVIFACSTNPKYNFIYPENINKKERKILKNINNLPKIAHFVRESIESQNNTIFEKYKFSVPFATFSTTTNGKNSDWELYGKNIKIFKKNIFAFKKYVIRGCVFALIVVCAIACILWLKYIK